MLRENREGLTMPRQLSINVLKSRRDAKLKGLTNVGPLLQGSLGRIGVTCGNPNCRCTQGEKRVSHILTKKVSGKTKSVYVPVEMVEEAQTWINEQRRVKKLMKEISDLNEQILRVYVKSKRARERNQAAVQRQSRSSQSL